MKGNSKGVYFINSRSTIKFLDFGDVLSEICPEDNLLRGLFQPDRKKLKKKERVIFILYLPASRSTW